MQKIIKVLICLFIFFSCPFFLPFSAAKYVIEDVIKAATLNIDRTKPKIEFFDFSTFIVSGNNNDDNTLYHITGHFKIIEKHIFEENLFQNSLKFFVNNTITSPDFKSFYIVSRNSSEIIYEFSFLINIKNSSLTIEIPAGVITDKSGLTNDKATYLITV